MCTYLFIVEIRGGGILIERKKKVFASFLRCLKGLAWACIFTHGFSAESSGRFMIFDATKTYFRFSVLEY